MTYKGRIRVQRVAIRGGEGAVACAAFFGVLLFFFGLVWRRTGVAPIFACITWSRWLQNSVCFPVILMPSWISALNSFSSLAKWEEFFSRIRQKKKLFYIGYSKKKNSLYSGTYERLLFLIFCRRSCSKRFKVSFSFFFFVFILSSSQKVNHWSKNLLEL